MDETRLRKLCSSPLLHVALLCTVGAICYLLSFHAPFVYDDGTTIVHNEAVRNLSRFFGMDGFRHHPRRFLGYLSFALNYRFCALQPWGYHVVNFLIHLAAGVGCYALTRVTFRTPRISGSSLVHGAPFVAVFAALLFVVHPVQTEAVVYVTQRFSSLAAVFYLLSLSLWVEGRIRMEARTGGTTAWYLGAVVSAVAAMLSKEIAITLPMAAIAYDLYFFKSSAGRRALAVLPLAAAVAAVPVTWLFLSPLPFSQALAHHLDGGAGIGWGDYVTTQVRVMVTYLRLLVLPVRQNLDYDFPIYASVSHPAILLSAAVLAAVAVVNWWLVRRRSNGIGDPAAVMIGFGLTWFFITLLVEAIVPLDDVIAEHRLYLPLAGVLMAGATAMALSRRWLTGPHIFVMSSAIVVALGTATVLRTVVWASPLSLWRDTVQKSPLKARPRYNLGTYLNDRGAYTEAIVQLKEAVRLEPDHALAWHNLGVALAAKGGDGEAVRSFRTAVELQPGQPHFHNSLGALLMKTGRVSEATIEFQTAVGIDPGFAEARNNLGAAWGAQGMLDRAVNELREAVRLDPGNDRFRENLKKAVELRQHR